MYRISIAFVVLAVWLGALGCGSAKSKPLHTFPSRAQLAEIAARPRSEQPLAADLIAPEAWQLELGAPQSNPGHALLTALAPRAQPEPALDCVARELGRLLLQAPDKRPSMSVQRFIAARCGALVAVSPYQSWRTEVAPEESDAAIVERLRQQLGAPIAATATRAGASLVREGQQAIVVVAHDTPEVVVEPFEQVVGEAGVLNIRGRVLFEVDALQAFVNVGAHAAQPCAFDPAVAPPAFSLRCQLAPGDDHAWVQLLALPRGRVLAHEVLGVIALRTAEAASTYRTSRVGEARPVRDAAGFDAAVLELLNAIRAQAGLAALRHAPRQSQTASSVTPAFFGAALSEDPAARDLLDAISLGLLAGWEVDGGIIREGDLTTSLVVDSHDAERWLADALERPLGRAVLLDPDARSLALGSILQPEPSVLAAVAVTYAFFEDEAQPGARAMQVLERLGRVRKARGLGSTVFVEDAPGVREELAAIQRGEATPSEALGALMRNMSASTGNAVQGFVWETHDLDAIEFPRELLQRGDLVLGAGVTHYRAPGGAWGQYVVLFVVVVGLRV